MRQNKNNKKVTSSKGKSKIVSQDTKVKHYLSLKKVRIHKEVTISNLTFLNLLLSNDFEFKKRDMMHECSNRRLKIGVITRVRKREIKLRKREILWGKRKIGWMSGLIFLSLLRNEDPFLLMLNK